MEATEMLVGARHVEGEGVLVLGVEGGGEKLARGLDDRMGNVVVIFPFDLGSLGIVITSGVNVKLSIVTRLSADGAATAA
jgi:hypothetical protein